MRSYLILQLPQANLVHIAIIDGKCFSCKGRRELRILNVQVESGGIIQSSFQKFHFPVGNKNDSSVFFSVPVPKFVMIEVLRPDF